MMNDEQVREMCRKLKPILGEKADKVWLAYLVEDEKGRRELALDIQIAYEKYLQSKKAILEKPILLEPPSLVESVGLVSLGDVIYNGKKLHKLYLSPEDFIKQIGIFSITGEGKTNTAQLLALQLLKYGVPFLVVDWKRSWRNLLNHEGNLPGLPWEIKKPFSVKDIQVFTIGRNASPFYWNPFRAPPGADQLTWISTIADVLEASHMSGPGVAYHLNKIYEALFRELKVNEQSKFYPNFFDGLKELEDLRVQQRELWWKQSATRILHSFTIGPAAQAFNARDPVKLEQLLEKSVIFELDMELSRPLRTFFSQIILRWLHLYRLNQGRTAILRHVAFFEEVHNMVQEKRKGREEYGPHNNLENLYREIRDFGQGIVSITQHPSLLPVYLLGNSHTLAFLGLQHEDDIEAARRALFLRREEQEYLNRLEVGEAIVKVKNRVKPCLVKIPLVMSGKNVSDEELKVKNPSQAEVKNHSYLPSSHDGKSEEHPSFLPGDINTEQERGKKVKNYEQALLADVLQNPLSTVSQRYRRLGMNPKFGNKSKNLLISDGLVQPRDVALRDSRIILLELTGKGRAALRDRGHANESEQEGVIHKFWKHKIAEHYNGKGHEVLIEEPVNGRADIVVKNANKRVAVEIETGNSDVMGNIERNLKAGFDEILVVATSREVEEKIKLELQAKGLNGKVKVTSVIAFDLG